ncbi:MAG: SURF1 family cytochrome oxidase biogenesis protein [Actinomycetota bacterium]
MSVWSVARRPGWIAALALALAIAAGFAGLSQWQLARSVSTGTVVDRSTETALPLQDVAKPQSPVTSRANAQLVTVTGRWNAGDYSLVSDRLNRGIRGYWVVGHFSAGLDSVTTAGLVVAVGWSPNRAGAASALATLQRDSSSALVQVTGRYLPAEGPQESDFENGKLSTITPGAFINTWRTADSAGVYGGYVTSAEAVAGLTRIDSPKPSSEIELNLLNIFYAIEWVVFAGFAIFLWFRLVRDTWEREQEEAAERVASAATSLEGAAADAQTADVN